MRITTFCDEARGGAAFLDHNQARCHLEGNLSDSKAQGTALATALRAHQIEYQHPRTSHNLQHIRRSSSWSAMADVERLVS